MGIWLQEFEKDARRITFCEGRESAETSTRNVSRRVEDGKAFQKVKRWKTEAQA
jgi:hypothetical protein